MNAKAVRVIGEPETWPNHFHVAGESPTDIRGATISQIFSAGNGIAVCTEGGACGATFTVFAVEDKELHDRIERALRLGVDVHEARGPLKSTSSPVLVVA